MVILGMRDSMLADQFGLFSLLERLKFPSVTDGLTNLSTWLGVAAAGVSGFDIQLGCLARVGSGTW